MQFLKVRNFLAMFKGSFDSLPCYNTSSSLSIKVVDNVFKFPNTYYSYYNCFTSPTPKDVDIALANNQISYIEYLYESTAPYGYEHEACFQKNEVKSRVIIHENENYISAKFNAFFTFNIYKSNVVKTNVSFRQASYYPVFFKKSKKIMIFNKADKPVYFHSNLPKEFVDRVCDYLEKEDPYLSDTIRYLGYNVSSRIVRSVLNNPYYMKTNNIFLSTVSVRDDCYSIKRRFLRGSKKVEEEYSFKKDPFVDFLLKRQVFNFLRLDFEELNKTENTMALKTFLLKCSQLKKCPTIESIMNISKYSVKEVESFLEDLKINHNSKSFNLLVHNVQTYSRYEKIIPQTICHRQPSQKSLSVMEYLKTGKGIDELHTSLSAELEELI